jgi:hypothetical protein
MIAMSDLCSEMYLESTNRADCSGGFRVVDVRGKLSGEKTPILPSQEMSRPGDHNR